MTHLLRADLLIIGRREPARAFGGHAWRTHGRRNDDRLPDASPNHRLHRRLANVAGYTPFALHDHRLARVPAIRASRTVRLAVVPPIRARALVTLPSITRPSVPRSISACIPLPVAADIGGVRASPPLCIDGTDERDGEDERKEQR